MTTNNYKHIANNIMMWIRSLFFSYVTFLSTIDVACVVSNISSSHANSNLSNRCFLHERLGFHI